MSVEIVQLEPEVNHGHVFSSIEGDHDVAPSLSSSRRTTSTNKDMSMRQQSPHVDCMNDVGRAKWPVLIGALVGGTCILVLLLFIIWRRRRALEFPGISKSLVTTSINRPGRVPLPCASTPLGSSLKDVVAVTWSPSHESLYWDKPSTCYISSQPN